MPPTISAKDQQTHIKLNFLRLAYIGHLCANLYPLKYHKFDSFYMSSLDEVFGCLTYISSTYTTLPNGPSKSSVLAYHTTT